MAGKETRFSLWALDPDISIGDVPALLQLDYSKGISYLQETDRLQQFDKTLLHSWREYDRDNGFSVKSYAVSGLEIKCIPVLAFLETAAPPGQAIDGNFIMPRSKRVQQSILDVFFFELSGRVYVIIVGPDYKTKFIRSTLMGGGRSPEESHKAWKKVQFKDIPNYSFSSDFFYWLISKENTTIKTPFVDMNISDIRFLSQSIERKDVKYESEGVNLLEEAMSKTGLGVNTRVAQVGTTISCDEGTLRIILFETGDCYIDNYESALIGPTGEIDPFDTHLDIGAIMLYAVILPALKSAFNYEKTNHLWTTEHQADSRKTWALGAINELGSENELTIEDIKNLDWFK